MTIAHRPETTVIVGSADHVKAALLRADTDGRLACIEDAVQLPGDRVRVTADLVPVTPQLPAAPAQAPRAPRPSRSSWWPEDWVDPLGAALVAVMVAASVTAVGALVWAIVMAVTALIAWVTEHAALVIGGVVGVVGLLVALGSAGGRCPGLHCGGCRGR